METDDSAGYYTEKANEKVFFILFIFQTCIESGKNEVLGRVANPRPVARIKTGRVAQPITDAADATGLGMQRAPNSLLESKCKYGLLRTDHSLDDYEARPHVSYYDRTPIISDY